MKKKINVILIKDNLKNGNKGEIISTTRGYAFNYLIPRKIGEIARKKKIKHLQMFENIKMKRHEANEVETKLLKNELEKIKIISIYKKKGENELIFGSITEKDIIKWFNKYTNIVINKTQIKVLEIKSIGIGYIKVYINSRVSTNITLNIVPTNI